LPNLSSQKTTKNKKPQTKTKNFKISNSKKIIDTKNQKSYNLANLPLFAKIKQKLIIYQKLTYANYAKS
jgi:hypothetical protein